MPNVREPKNARSIEKKNKIIKAGLEIFGTNGYYNTTTVDIAKKAGVSTGIVYNYFLDKKDIFLQSLKLYFDNIYSPILDKLNSIKCVNLEDTVDDMINFAIESHKEDLLAHEEMIAMSHLDEDVHKVFIYAENKMTEQIMFCLQRNNINIENIKEKVHILYNLVENLCHEYFYHRHDYINYSVMINETKKLILALLKS